MVAVLSDGRVMCAAETSYSAGTGLSESGTTFSVDTSTVQARVTGTCAAGTHVDSVNLDGTVSCGPDLDTTYVAGAGLSQSGSTFSIDTSAVQARVTGACAEGTHATAVAADGSLTCVADPSYTAGAGLSLSGSTFSADTGVLQARITGICGAGTHATAVNADGSLSCAADPSYTAGSGLSRSGSTFSADTGVVQARVTGSCSYGQAIRAVNGDGTVSCGPFAQIVVVPGNDTDINNGTHLFNTVAGLNPSAPTLVLLEAGVFDLGAHTLVLNNANVTLMGAGQEATTITGDTGFLVSITASTSIASLTIELPPPPFSTSRAVVRITAGTVHLRDVRVSLQGSVGAALTLVSSPTVVLKDTDIDSSDTAVFSSGTAPSVTMVGGSLSATVAIAATAGSVKVANASISGTVVSSGATIHCLGAMRPDFSNYLSTTCQ
jgi:hypothetical protein